MMIMIMRFWWGYLQVFLGNSGGGGGGGCGGGNQPNHNFGGQDFLVRLGWYLCNWCFFRCLDAIGPFSQPSFWSDLLSFVHWCYLWNWCLHWFLFCSDLLASWLHFIHTERRCKLLSSQRDAGQHKNDDDGNDSDNDDVFSDDLSCICLPRTKSCTHFGGRQSLLKNI